MVEGAVELVDGVGAEGVAHFGAVEGDADDAGVFVPVVGDVGEVVEAVDCGPLGGVEGVAAAHGYLAYRRRRVAVRRDGWCVGQDGRMDSNVTFDPAVVDAIASIDLDRIGQPGGLDVRVVGVPLAVRFRGVDVREAVLIKGPAGWGEFAPFKEYEPQEAAAWLAAGIEQSHVGLPAVKRDSVEVNATVPAVAPEQVAEVLDRFPGCRTVKVKVADRPWEQGALDDDVARVAAVREYCAARDVVAQIRVDANRAWSVEQATQAVRRFGPLQYVEQPCATVDELAQLRATFPRMGVFVQVAADESIRRAEDPFEVARRRACDVAVLKVAPLGGVRRTLAIADFLAEQGIAVTIASALDTGVGMYGGLVAAANLQGFVDDDLMEAPRLAAGLATGGLFEPGADVVPDSLFAVVDGAIAVPRQAPVVDDQRLAAAEARVSDEVRQWWLAHLRASLVELRKAVGLESC